MSKRAKKSFRPFYAADDGSVTAEFVISLPLLLLAMVIVFEFGQLFLAHHIAVNNLRAATRFISRAPLRQPFLSQAVNIATTGDPARATGVYAWAQKSCAQGGVCVSIDPGYASFSAPAFRTAGSVIRVAADVPLPLPLFGLINALSGGGVPAVLTFRIVAETRYFGE